MPGARSAKSKKRILPWVIVVVLGIAMGVGGGYLYRLTKIFPGAGGSLANVFSPPFEGKTFVRILVLGEDNTSKRRSTGYGLSDTIMVVALDLNAKTVRAVSVPRDSSVEIPGHGTQKINAAFAFGGPRMSQDTVKELLGLDSIDYYIKTDIEGLTNIVDMVGGVGIDVEKDMHYNDRHGHLHINLRKGYRHLDGEKALGYVRFRHDAMGDIWRTQRQQKFLRALAHQLVLPQNFLKLQSIMEEVQKKGYVETNMTGKDLYTIASLTKDIPPDKVETETLPGTPIRVGKASMWTIDRVQTAQIVDKMLAYPSSTSPTAANSAKVEVLNGSGIPGLAKTVADKLQQSGFEVASTGNAGAFTYDSCQIIVHNPKAGGVDNIAELIGCRDIKNDERKSASDVTVIVGKDYKPK